MRVENVQHREGANDPDQAKAAANVPEDVPSDPEVISNGCGIGALLGVCIVTLILSAGAAGYGGYRYARSKRSLPLSPYFPSKSSSSSWQPTRNSRRILKP